MSDICWTKHEHDTSMTLHVMFLDNEVSSNACDKDVHKEYDTISLASFSSLCNEIVSIQLLCFFSDLNILTV